MEDRDDTLWAGLGSIEAFIASPPTSPRPSPNSHSPSSPCSPWSWQNLPPPRVLQVRLDDGEPADPTPDLDLLLPSLGIASGRIEKQLPHNATTEPLSVPVKPPIKTEPVKMEAVKAEPAVAKPENSLKQEPVVKMETVPVEKPPPKPVAKPKPIPVPSTPKLPPPKPTIHRSPVRVQGISRSMPQARKPLAEVPSKTNEGGTMSLKEKREREARQFPKEVLGNLDGTTSAEVRKMNATERELVLYKRKLRNRESARRSRQKRQATLAELQEEIDDLMQVTGRMVEVGISLHEENGRLRERLGLANAEIKSLRNMYESDGGGGGEAAALKMKLGG